jgi:hypothetical protein
MANEYLERWYVEQLRRPIPHFTAGEKPMEVVSPSLKRNSRSSRRQRRLTGGSSRRRGRYDRCRAAPERGCQATGMHDGETE